MEGCGGGESDRERRAREQWVQWTGSIRNEFPEMDTHGWAELAWIWEVEAGFGGWEAHARPAGQKERDRKMTERTSEGGERERPPGADRCSPPLQLRPHSWPGSLYIFLYAYVSLALIFSLSLSPPVKTHAEILGITHMTSYGMLHHVHYSSFNMASLPAKLQHSHNASQTVKDEQEEKSPLMHPHCVLLQIIISWLICSRGLKYSTLTPNKAGSEEKNVFPLRIKHNAAASMYSNASGSSTAARCLTMRAAVWEKAERHF